MEMENLRASLVYGSHEKGAWLYRVVVPKSGHTWDVIIARHRSGFDHRVIESYSWDCRLGPMQGGSSLTKQRIETRDGALQAAMAYVLRQEEGLARSPAGRGISTFTG